MQIQNITPEIADSMSLKQATGALVSEPQKDSPAAKAGIHAADAGPTLVRTVPAARVSATTPANSFERTIHSPCCCRVRAFGVRNCS